MDLIAVYKIMRSIVRNDSKKLAPVKKTSNIRGLGQGIRVDPRHIHSPNAIWNLMFKSARHNKLQTKYWCMIHKIAST